MLRSRSVEIFLAAYFRDHCIRAVLLSKRTLLFIERARARLITLNYHPINKPAQSEGLWRTIRYAITQKLSTEDVARNVKQPVLRLVWQPED